MDLFLFILFSAYCISSSWKPIFFFYLKDPCYRLNVCVPLPAPTPGRFIYWYSIPSKRVFADELLWKWLGHQSTTLLMGLYPCTIDLSEFPCPFFQGRTQKEFCSPEEDPHPTMLPSDLGLLGFRILRNKFLLFRGHPICGILLWQPEWTKKDKCKYAFPWALQFYILCNFYHNQDTEHFITLESSFIRISIQPSTTIITDLLTFSNIGYASFLEFYLTSH